MDSFTSCILRQAYEKVKGKGDRLAKLNSAVNREVFHLIIVDKQKKRDLRGISPGYGGFKSHRSHHLLDSVKREILTRK